MAIAKEFQLENVYKLVIRKSVVPTFDNSSEMICTSIGYYKDGECLRESPEFNKEDMVDGLWGPDHDTRKYYTIAELVDQDLKSTGILVSDDIKSEVVEILESWRESL